MSQETLQSSHKKYGALYPVLVDANGNVIDGFHRIKVDPNWEKRKLDWVKTDADRIKIGIVANFDRREITTEEIRDKLGQLAELTGWDANRLAEELNRSYTWVMKYLPQKYKRKYETLRDNSTPRVELDSEPALTNVWIPETKYPEGYGDKDFHGVTPPFILQQCIQKYTEENDIVLDVMAGSGTTIDVCNKLKRKCLAFDIKPYREDITYADASALQMEKDSIDFIFAHFPYWKMVQYSDSPNDLSNMNFDDFCHKTEEIMKLFSRCLKKGKYCVILIGDLRREGRLFDLSAYLSIYGSKYLTLFDKVIYVGKGQESLQRKSRSLTEWRAREFGYHVVCQDTLLIFRKD